MNIMSISYHKQNLLFGIFNNNLLSVSMDGTQMLFPFCLLIIKPVFLEILVLIQKYTIRYYI